MNPSPLLFLSEHEYIELELSSEELQGAHEVGARQGGRRAPTLVAWVWDPWSWSFASIFYYFQKDAAWSFRSFWELLFLHINNTMAILLKTTSVRVSSIEIMQVRVQNKGNRFGKVDTMETLQLPQDSPIACPQAIELTN